MKFLKAGSRIEIRWWKAHEKIWCEKGWRKNTNKKVAQNWDGFTADGFSIPYYKYNSHYTYSKPLKSNGCNPKINQLNTKNFRLHQTSTEFHVNFPGCTITITNYTDTFSTTNYFYNLFRITIINYYKTTHYFSNHYGKLSEIPFPYLQVVVLSAPQKAKRKELEKDLTLLRKEAV